jgi:hypothetical protein
MDKADVGILDRALRSDLFDSSKLRRVGRDCEVVEAIELQPGRTASSMASSP